MIKLLVNSQQQKLVQLSTLSAIRSTAGISPRKSRINQDSVSWKVVWRMRSSGRCDYIYFMIRHPLLCASMWKYFFPLFKCFIIFGLGIWCSFFFFNIRGHSAWRSSMSLDLAYVNLVNNMGPWISSSPPPWKSFWSPPSLISWQPLLWKILTNQQGPWKVLWGAL